MGALLNTTAFLVIMGVLKGKGLGEIVNSMKTVRHFRLGLYVWGDDGAEGRGCGGMKVNGLTECDAN